ncbi:MAG: HPr family phosphocarrier protein [Planctomycetes bacterium]|nr:HPr family phosphocarrier protein [Planctomycetota bacterium]
MVSVTIADKAFQKLIAKRARIFLGLACYLSECKSNDKIMIRPFLGQLLSQSMQIEELLDAYDAGNSCRWCSFRSLTATMKLFSDVSYELLHIQHSLPAYRLLPIDRDFVKATEEALEFTGDILSRAAKQMVARAEHLGLTIPQGSLRKKSYTEELPAGRLPHDCGTRRIETVSETVTLLATAFLNLAAESKDVRAASQAKPQEYASYVLGSISEEKLRSLELRFHNLQSLYDTYVSGTEAEDLDTDLPVLRGHISVVFHLLKTATSFAHYYERHVNKELCDSPTRFEPLVKAKELLGVLMNYSVTSISMYIDCAEHLCQRMLKRYAEVGRVEVSVPPYRGFHVRPSTMISKLVQHYGSEIRMQMDEEIYDASSPLELFRANEKINAQKRRWLASEIVHLKLVQELEQAGQSNIDPVVRSVVLMLAERGKLILYEQPLQLPEEPTGKEGTLLEKVIHEITRLLAMGKIDVDAKLTTTFIGDKRVLADIELLAESGYGEDNFGNNVPLPEKLMYLRR